MRMSCGIDLCMPNVLRSCHAFVSGRSWGLPHPPGALYNIAAQSVRQGFALISVGRICIGWVRPINPSSCVEYEPWGICVRMVNLSLPAPSGHRTPHAGRIADHLSVVFGRCDLDAAGKLQDLLASQHGNVWVRRLMYGSGSVCLFLEFLACVLGPQFHPAPHFRAQLHPPPCFAGGWTLSELASASLVRSDGQRLKALQALALGG